jgi:hypothetical protein
MKGSQMLAGFSDRERALLALPVPALGLPVLIAPTERELAIRAFEIDYPDEVFPRGEKTLVAVMKILGAIDSTYEERLKLIHIQER